MTFYNVINPSTMIAGAPEDISQVLANFNAVAAVLNGALDNTNINASAAIDQTKLALPFMGRNLGWSKGSLPPASPSDGDLWLLPADSTNGVNLLFRYNAGSASAYKWEFVGGPPMQNEVLTQDNRTGNTYGDTTTTGPSVTVPRPGDYDMEFSAMGVIQTSDAYLYVAPSIGGATPTDNDAAHIYCAFGYNDRFGRTIRRTLSGANGLIRLQYRSSNASNQQVWQYRNLHVWPVRVS